MMSGNTQFKCLECGHLARDSFNLKRHTNSTHLKCSFCRKSFVSSGESLAHQAVCSKPLAKQCSLCSVQCPSTEKIEEHLVRDHGISLQNETHTFDSEQQYRDWKRQIESSQRSFFKTDTTRSRSTRR
uniref:C2H2-type domain-containing protein n=1 Tax=Lygus hesperus TaxID=30085 RepID=A0A0K8SX45_LYGHE